MVSKVILSLTVAETFPAASFNQRYWVESPVRSVSVRLILVERAVVDARGAVASALEDGTYVIGGGAAEMELAKTLHSYAVEIGGREQLAIQAFAEALESIPKTLAENAGLDPIDILTELKAKHDAGMKWAGIDVFTGKVMDAWKKGVIEPLKIKTQAVSSASEVAVMILRIDDVIASSGSKDKGPKMPPGMGGMGGEDMGY